MMKAWSLHENQPVYNSSWWDKTFPTLSDEQMVHLYRMRRSTMDWIYERMVTVAPKERNGASHLLKLATVLHYCSDPSALRRNGHLHGVPKSTLDDWIPLVASWINTALAKAITMPTTQNGSAQAIAARVLADVGISGVAGFIDSSLIPLARRPSHPELADSNIFWTRKGFPAYHLQAVCDDRGLFTDVWIGDAGRVHDSRVYAGSELSKQIENFLSPEFHLLGDKGYPLETHLLTPYKGDVSGFQRRFNDAQASARQVIERTFGFLKMRWQILRRMPLGVDNWQPVTMMCCILHNVCTVACEEIDFEQDEELQDLRNARVHIPNHRANPALTKRDNIARLVPI
jgi:hypothetical protein